ncbi:hypothetical protein EBR43_07945 [bacterium]|nr:hypothetical protein [bacterium]
MNKPIDQIAEELCDKLSPKFEDITLGDESADDTDDESKARFFNFTYQDTDSKDKPIITIHLSDSGDVEKRALKIHYITDILDSMNPDQKKRWVAFLKDLRYFAKANWLNFDVRNLTKPNLGLRDIKKLTKTDSVDVDQVKVTESRLFGNTKVSYENVGPVKLMVRHSQNINPEIQGSRTRNIESIFVETAIGERFLMPFTKLSPARAMARHIAEGGKIGDEIAEFIEESAKEMGSMGVFVRSMRRRTFEDTETVSMIEAAIERYNEVKSNLNRMSSQKGYTIFKETFQPNYIEEDDFNIDELKERFVKKLFDDRLGDALPHVYRAYKAKQKYMQNSYVAEFDRWADDIVEGTWDNDESQVNFDEVKDLMSKPLLAGIDGIDAIPVLNNIINDDMLSQQISNLSSKQGQDIDVRSLIIDWLNSNGYEQLANECQTIMTNSMQEPQTQSPSMEESLGDLCKLAGIAKI